jgi:catechol 2,3-dioxygenase-like lactoylglutathione lyase family enzyme
MQQPKVKFYSLNLFVEDVDASIFFYERLGFHVVTNGETEDYLFADLKLLDESDFMICLKQSFKHGENKGKISIEFTSDDEKGFSYEDVYKDLTWRGFSFTNVPPAVIHQGLISDKCELADPDGYSLELV